MILAIVIWQSQRQASQKQPKMLPLLTVLVMTTQLWCHRPNLRLIHNYGCFFINVQCSSVKGHFKEKKRLITWTLNEFNLSWFWFNSKMVVLIFALYSLLLFLLYIWLPSPHVINYKNDLHFFNGSSGRQRLWRGWRCGGRVGGCTNEVFLFYCIQVLHHLWVKNTICKRLCKLQRAGLSHNCTISQYCSNPLTHICWQWSKIRWPLFLQCVCDDAQQTFVLCKCEKTNGYMHVCA